MLNLSRVLYADPSDNLAGVWWKRPKVFRVNWRSMLWVVPLSVVGGAVKDVFTAKFSA